MWSVAASRVHCHLRVGRLLGEQMLHAAWAWVGVGREHAQVWSPREQETELTLLPTGPKLSALECLEGMASGLYSELFTLLVSLVNRWVPGTLGFLA